MQPEGRWREGDVEVVSNIKKGIGREDVGMRAIGG